MHPELCLPSLGMTHYRARGGGNGSTDILRLLLTLSGLLYCFLSSVDYFHSQWRRLTQLRRAYPPTLRRVV